MFRDVFRGFSRTLGRILAYLVVGAVLSLFALEIGGIKVKAATFQNDLDVNLPQNLMWLNNNNATSSSNLSGVVIQKPTVSGKSVDLYYPLDSEDFKLGTYGMTISMCGLNTIPNSFYSLTMYFEYSQFGYYILSQYSQVSYRVGVGTALLETGKNRSINPTTYNTAVNVAYYDSYPFQYYTIIFKSNASGTCVSTSFSSNNNLPLNYAGFIGYQSQYLGQDSLTIDELNQSLLNVQNNIQNSIDSMKDEQKITNDKLDDINDSINSDNVDSSNDKINDFFNDFDSGNDKGLQDIVSLPLKYINKLSEPCKSFDLPLGQFGNTTIECMSSSVYNKSEFTSLVNLISLLINGFICYRCLKSLFEFIHDLRDPDNDKVEVLDL